MKATATKQKPINERTTKYIAAVRMQLERVGHATNAQLLALLQRDYPNLSATTVHRITARMLERHELQQAPAGKDNVLRYDSNVTPHDHFMCTQCGILRDAYLDEKVRPLIEESIGNGCSISGRLVVSGLCKQCNKGGK